MSLNNHESTITEVTNSALVTIEIDCVGERVLSGGWAEVTSVGADVTGPTGLFVIASKPHSSGTKWVLIVGTGSSSSVYVRGYARSV